jgi:hypothetical protein
VIRIGIGRPRAALTARAAGTASGAQRRARWTWPKTASGAHFEHGQHGKNEGVKGNVLAGSMRAREGGKLARHGGAPASDC